MAQANTFAKRFEGSAVLARPAVGPRDRARQLRSSAATYYDELLERASWFYEAVSFSEAMKSQTPGVGQAYLGSYTDADGDWLDGGRELHAARPRRSAGQVVLVGHRLRRRDPLPDRQPPAARRPRLRDPTSSYNDDGSVDLFFGPDPARER